MPLRAEHTLGLKKNSPRTDGSCSIHAEEVEAFMDWQLASFFEMTGVNIRDAHMFFKMLTTSTPTDRVDVEAFVEACLRITWYATSSDLHTLILEVRGVAEARIQFFAELDKELTDIRWKLHSIAKMNRPSYQLMPAYIYGGAAD